MFFCHHFLPFLSDEWKTHEEDGLAHKMSGIDLATVQMVIAQHPSFISVFLFSRKAGCAWALVNATISTIVIVRYQLQLNSPQSHLQLTPTFSADPVSRAGLTGLLTKAY